MSDSGGSGVRLCGAQDTAQQAGTQRRPVVWVHMVVNTAASRLLGGVHNRPVACANMKWCVSADPQASCSRSDQLSKASASCTPRVSGASSEPVESQKCLCSPSSSHSARLACTRRVDIIGSQHHTFASPHGGSDNSRVTGGEGGGRNSCCTGLLKFFTE